MDETSLKGLYLVTDVWKDIDQGAATMLVAALDPKLNCKYARFLQYCENGRNRALIVCVAENGVYLDDCQVKRPSKWAADPFKAEMLWKLSEDLVGERFSYAVESKL